MRCVRHASIPTYLILSSFALGACADDATVPDADAISDGIEGGSEDRVAWLPARGISIIEIEANQGTRVAVTGENGDWVGPHERTMKLVSDRDTLLRVHWDVDDGWQPHEVKARLTLDVAGEKIVHEQILDVTGDSSRTTIDRAFYFGLAAQEGETVPGTLVSVELLEPAYDQNYSLPEAVNTAPVVGPQLIGFESDPMQLKVVLVPVHYTAEGKDSVPNLDEANVEKLIDSLYERNPVQDIIYKVRGPVGYDKPMTNLADLLPLMAAAKQNDGAGPNVYYHAFIDVGCPVVGCGNIGVAGIAAVAGAAQNASLTRVGASVFWASQTGNIGITVDTFVHELGHNQGLGHVACPGVQAAGPDPSYPHANGTIGEWGFGIRSFTLHNPTASHDYMSYCGNTWGSDWTFLKTYNRIQALTSWDHGNAGANGSGAGEEEWTMGEELVIGALYPDGTERWFTLPGGIDVEQITPSDAVGFELDGAMIDQPAVVQTLSDGETQWVIAPLPEGRTIGEVERVEHIHDGEVRRVIPRAEIVRDILGADSITL
jgi:hypothetical protein